METSVKNALILTHQNYQTEGSSTLLTFGLKVKEWMKQFHRILEKELVFFLKKTTNLHSNYFWYPPYQKKKKKEKQQQQHWEHSSYVIANTGLGNKNGTFKQRKGKSLLSFLNSVGNPSTEAIVVGRSRATDSIPSSDTNVICRYLKRK